MSTEPTATTSPGSACSFEITPAYGDGQLDDRLGRLDLGDRLVERHRVALGDEPLDELGLGQALAEVGKTELGDHSVTPLRLLGRSRTRSTPSRIRSRSGTWCFSSFAGG